MNKHAMKNPNAPPPGRRGPPPAPPGPLVTLLCVSRGRRDRLSLALHCARWQTVPCRLLVIHQGLEFDAEPQPDVDFVEAAPGLVLGELRNVGMRHVHTPYWAQWDDDDWHHPDRIRAELETFTDHPRHPAGCMLSRWTVYDESTGRAYLSPRRQWEGSLVVKRAAIRKTQYPRLTHREDTPFVETLLAKGLRFMRLARPDLYVYRIRAGSGSWPDQHYAELLEGSNEINPGLAGWIGRQFQEIPPWPTKNQADTAPPA